MIFYAALGRPRRVVTEHDLRDALDAVFSGQPPVPKSETQAVGCYIPDLSAYLTLIRSLLSLVLLGPISCGAQTPVILISIDTLRADRVGAGTPNINAYGAHGTVFFFTHAETQVPFTLPSHTALMTSTYPFQNGVERKTRRGRFQATLDTLASVLKSHGYQTAAFIGSIFLERQLGLDRGFDFYDSPFSVEAFSKLSGSMLFAGGPHNPLFGTRTALRTACGFGPRTSGCRRIAASQSSHSFIYSTCISHTSLVHTDAEVDSVDKLLGGFQARLRQDGWWDRSLVIITADHGEGLGDHGESDHGYFVYESTLHVPLIVHWPEGRPLMPERAEQPVGLIDVAPTYPRPSGSSPCLHLSKGAACWMEAFGPY